MQIYKNPPPMQTSEHAKQNQAPLMLYGYTYLV